MSKNHQQKEPVKQMEQPAAAPIADAAEQDKQAPMTMKIKPDTKSRLEELKDIFKASDLDAVVNRLIEVLPQKMSTEQEIHLIMPVSKYRWLISKCYQHDCDCRNCLNDSRV